MTQYLAGCLSAMLWGGRGWPVVLRAEHSNAVPGSLDFFQYHRRIVAKKAREKWTLLQYALLLRSGANQGGAGCVQ